MATVPDQAAYQSWFAFIVVNILLFLDCSQRFGSGCNLGGHFDVFSNTTLQKEQKFANKNKKNGMHRLKDIQRQQLAIEKSNKYCISWGNR